MTSKSIAFRVLEMRRSVQVIFENIYFTQRFPTRLLEKETDVDENDHSRQNIITNA